MRRKIKKKCPYYFCVFWRHVFQHRKYNKYEAYANAKRAQVALARLVTEEYGSKSMFQTMHPGWNKTVGAQQSMPWLYCCMQHRLRTVEEGADAIVWLALTKEIIPSRRFCFDRQIVLESFFAYIKPSAEMGQRLWCCLDDIYRGLYV